MRRTCALLAACCAVLLAQPTRAQVPAAPAVPAAIPAVPAAAPPMGFFASLGMACKAKKERCCASPLGKLLANMTRPMQAMTGGVLPSCCPPGPSPADLASPGPVGAAAKIKAEEAQAKARRAAVKFLATVDCHYYPEAEAGLIGALRCDRNECVRWEAAHSLATGCCCNKRTIEALAITVSGSEKDGNPGETSFRVRAEAFAALQFCLANHHDAPVRPENPLPPEQPAALRLPEMSAGEQTVLTAYYQNVSDKPWGDVLRDAQQAADRAQSANSHGLPPTGERNLISLWSNAQIAPQQAPTTPVEPMPAPPLRSLTLPARHGAPIEPHVTPTPPVIQPLPPTQQSRSLTLLEPPLPRRR
jgi:hypothetical protein